MKRLLTHCAPALLLLSVTALSAVALADGIELRTQAEVEVTVETADGNLETRREPAAQVVPGDEVIYTMHYRNDGAERADDVVITNPIPEHMQLLRTAALEPGLDLSFSVDGGQFYDALARLEVTGEDGRLRPATASDCTHVRWTFQRPLEPGEEGHVTYTAQLQ